MQTRNGGKDRDNSQPDGHPISGDSDLGALKMQQWKTQEWKKQER